MVLFSLAIGTFVGIKVADDMIGSRVGETDFESVESKGYSQTEKFVANSKVAQKIIFRNLKCSKILFISQKCFNDFLYLKILMKIQKLLIYFWKHKCLTKILLILLLKNIDMKGFIRDYNFFVYFS